MAGWLVVETVFGRPELGTIAVHATQEPNLPVWLVPAFVVAMNLLVCLIFAVIDPRA